MNRKVIQITNGNIALCDDGTIWRFKVMETTNAGSEGYEYSTVWTRLDGVPQPEDETPSLDEFVMENFRNNPPVRPCVRVVSDAYEDEASMVAKHWFRRWFA